MSDVGLFVHSYLVHVVVLRKDPDLPRSHTPWDGG